MAYKQKLARPTSRKPFLVALCVVILLVGVFAALELTHKTHFFHKAQATTNFRATPTTGGASVSLDKGEPSSSATTTNSGSSNGSQPGDTKSTTGGPNQTELVAPSGDFVSNHHPDLSGSPAPNTMTSVCATTSGATCTINFSKDGVTKSLPAQLTDRGGSAYWNWKLQDIGLSAGSWKITAIATLNGQTKSTNDALTLEVGP